MSSYSALTPKAVKLSPCVATLRLWVIYISALV